MDIQFSSWFCDILNMIYGYPNVETQKFIHQIMDIEKSSGILDIHDSVISKYLIINMQDQVNVGLQK